MGVNAEPRTIKVLFQPAQGRTEVVRNEVFSVFPVVALVEGVIHAGNSPNPELALASEFGQLPAAWNGSPVVLSHPLRDGIAVSANSPEVFGTNTMGFMFGTHLEDKKLKSEIWINRKWAAENGQQDVLNLLDNGEPLEVSTGLFARVDPVPGLFNGESYMGVWRNVMPDHLAILPPGVKGACSSEDGCGVPRVNQGEQPMTTPAQSGDSTSQSTPPTQPITSNEGCGCPAAQATQSNQEAAPSVEQEERVLGRLARSFMSFLGRANQETQPTQSTPPTTAAAPTAEAASTPSATPTFAVPTTLKELSECTLLSEELKLELNSLVAFREGAATSLRTEILGCAQNVFTEDELKAMNHSQLEKTAKLAKQAQSQSQTKPEGTTSDADFSGRGASRDSSQGADPGFTAPLLVFPRKSA